MNKSQDNQNRIGSKTTCSLILTTIMLTTVLVGASTHHYFLCWIAIVVELISIGWMAALTGTDKSNNKSRKQ